MDRLSEIRARCEELEQSGEGFTVVRPVYIQGALLDDGYSEKWSALAAHAREDIPYLLAEVERLKQANEIASAVWDSSALCAAEADRDRLQAELDAAKKCINDVQTYLDLGSAKYIAATIKQWRGKEHD